MQVSLLFKIHVAIAAQHTVSSPPSCKTLITIKTELCCSPTHSTHKYIEVLIVHASTPLQRPLLFLAHKEFPWPEVSVLNLGLKAPPQHLMVLLLELPAKVLLPVVSDTLWCTTAPSPAISCCPQDCRVPSSPGSAPASPLKYQKSTNPTEIPARLLLSKGGAELCYSRSPLVPGKESVTPPGMGSAVGTVHYWP